MFRLYSDFITTDELYGRFLHEHNLFVVVVINMNFFKFDKTLCGVKV